MFDFELLKELCLLDGTTGREDAVRVYIEEKIKRMRVRFPLFVENMGEDLKMRIAQKRDQVQEKISETLKNRKKKKQARKQR